MLRTRPKKKQTQQPVVVIAGAAGFVGSHLAESLLDSGVKVIGLDDLATGSIANMASFHRHPNFDFIECNVNRMLPQELYSKRITHIVHAMGLDTHAPNKAATLASLLAGSFATKNLLDLAVKRGSVFLLTSSINVYEGLASSTSLNNYFGSTQHQKAQYSLYEAKRYSEGLCQMYADEYNLDVRVARLSTVYGPRMDLCDDSFLDTLIHQTLDGQDLVIDEEGSQEVHLTYIDDVVFGLSKLLFVEGEQYHRSIYPIVSPEKTSVISVAYTLRTFLPPGKEVKFAPQEQRYDFALPNIDFARTKRELDWEPQVSLTDGLKLTIESFRKGTSQPIRRHVVGRDLFNTQPPEIDKGSNGQVTIPSAGVTRHDGVEELEPGVTTTAVSTEKLNDLVPLMVGGPQKGLPFRNQAAGSTKSAETSEVKPTEKKEEKATKEDKQQGPSDQPKVRLAKKSWWKRLFVALLLVGLYGAIGRPVMHTTAYSAAGGWDLYRGATAARNFDFSQAEQRFRQSSLNFADARQGWGGVAMLAQLTGWKGVHEDFLDTLSAASVATDGLTHLSQAAKPWPAYLEQLLPVSEEQEVETGNEGEFAELVNETKNSLAYTRTQLSRAQETLPGADFTRVAGASVADGHEEVATPETGGLVGWLRQALSEARLYLSQGEQVLEVLPSVLGDGGSKTYLLMFQNNNELRPTGGFMGSYGVVTAQAGKIVEFRIDDIYNPDGQLKSDIDSPTAIKKSLGLNKLPLRDANWSPDVPTSAEMVSKLYTQATGVDVDGVVFVTARALEPLLEALGPIHLANFNETVDADNFDQLAQKHSNVGFTPGSTGKRDFLGVLAEAIMARIEQGGNGELFHVGQALSQSLNSKEVQLYFEDPAVTALADQYDWSGRMKDTSGDYLRVVDANLGVNKSNFYITRSTDYAINVDRYSRLEGVITITWKHSGTSGTWPGGDYKSYVRVYAPAGASLLDATDFDSDNLDSAEEQGKKVYGGYVTVPYDSEKTVTLRYKLPKRLGLLESNGEYSLLWQKQSGLGDEAISVSFNAPSFIDVEQVDGGAIDDNGRVRWDSESTVGDQTFRLWLTH